MGGEQQAQPLEPKAEGTQELIEGMYDYMWTCIREYWSGKGDVDFNRDLAEGIRKLTVAGINKIQQLKHPS